MKMHPGICHSKTGTKKKDRCRIKASFVVFIAYTLKNYLAELPTAVISNTGKPMVAGYLARGKSLAKKGNKPWGTS